MRSRHDVAIRKTTRKRAGVVLVAMLASAVHGREASAQKPTKTVTEAPQTRAAALVAKGSEAYRRGDFKEAISYLLPAYGLDPQPVLLYNLARAYEGLGDLDAAIDAFTRYLDADPNAGDRGATEQRVATLKRQRDERIALEEQRDAERQRADAERTERERRQAEVSVKRRSVGPYVIGGVGVAGLTAGLVFGLVAISKHDEAAQASTSQRAAIDAEDKAKSFATVSTVAFVAGGILAGAAVVWWVLDGRSSVTPRRAAGLRLASGGLDLVGIFP